MTDKEDLDRKVHSRRPFAVGAVALVLALVALGVGTAAVLIESQHQNERLAEASAANVEHDYQNCLVGNDSRAKLRKLEDRIANPNPYDVNAIIKYEVIDINIIAKRATTVQEINEAVIAASNGRLKGILGVTHHPNVSIDFNHDPRSSIMALDQTKVMDGNFVSVLSWYDNEWGFSNRMGDTAVAFGKTIA